MGFGCCAVRAGSLALPRFLEKWPEQAWPAVHLVKNFLTDKPGRVTSLVSFFGDGLPGGLPVSLVLAYGVLSEQRKRCAKQATKSNSGTKSCGGGKTSCKPNSSSSSNHGSHGV